MRTMTLTAAVLAIPAAHAQDCALLDLNGCGCVDIIQLNIMLGLVTNGGPSQGDFDNDGDTDAIDLAFFMANFAACATNPSGKTATRLPEIITNWFPTVRQRPGPNGLVQHEVFANSILPGREVVTVTSANLSAGGNAFFEDVAAPCAFNGPWLPIAQPCADAAGITSDSFIALGEVTGEPDPLTPLTIDLDATAYDARTAISAPSGWIGDPFRTGTPDASGIDDDGDGLVPVLSVLMPANASASLEIGLAIAMEDGRLLIAESITPIEAPCPADTNADGILSPADFSAWVSAFNAMSAACDQNADGACTPADFSAWVANYNAGC